jgi:APA family basic amino acid/polyamine antiporter
MANDRLFFQNFCSVHKRYQTPAIAILALGAWSAMLASLGGFAELAAGAIFIGWIFYGLAAAAIFPIRRASKNTTLPYRVPGYPWTPGIFVLVAAAIVGNSIYVAIRDPGQFKSLVVALVLFLLGTPAYFLWTMSRRRSTP